MIQLELFKTQSYKKPVNVASVPMRSPFRYPGGKTWFVPYARQWLRQFNCDIKLIEPFAGGGIISLTAAFENLATHVTMAEIDKNIAAVWRTILNSQADWLAEEIVKFKPTIKKVSQFLEKSPKSIRERAFCTILRNRFQHGGILAPGAGLIKNGENGKGIKSRWYPQTLKKRILKIVEKKDIINFIEGDGIELIKKNKTRPDTAFFIDPPYTKASRRLYLHHEINHEKLFSLLANVKGDVLMTYDDTVEIEDLAASYGFEYERVPMKTTHHLQKYELVISKNLDWLREFLS